MGGTASGSLASVSFAVSPPSVGAIQFDRPSVFGGQPATATVTLNGTAPSGGLAIAITSSNPQLSKLPQTITVPGGQKASTFSIVPTTVASVTQVTVYGAVSGSGTNVGDGTTNTILLGSAQATLFVFPLPQLQSISVTPSPVNGGDALSLALNVTVVTGTSPGVAAPVATATIAIDRPDLVQFPATAAVPGYQLVPRATVVGGTTSAPATDQNVTITVTLEGRSASTTLLVRKPPID
jgi:hypothetical protein